MNSRETAECCPRFDPEPWDQKELNWQERRFVKDRVRCVFHIPINFGAVMKRNMQSIEAAGAKPDEMIVLADDQSLWSSDVYIGVSRDVANANNVAITGTFLSKVFEGPYSHMRKWMDEAKRFVAERGKEIKKLYCYYTTCPKCAKKYGKNYVVILAQV